MKSIDCRLKLLTFHPDSEFGHVAITNPQMCKNCNHRVCLTICPTGVFKWNYQCDEQPVLVQYEQCIECGACRLVCPQNNIQFQYPNGGYGVCFNDGVSIYPVSETP